MSSTNTRKAPVSGNGGPLPGLLYEILPPLYLVVGAAAATGIGESYGRLAGVMLIVAGFIIWRLRRQGVSK